MEESIPYGHYPPAMVDTHPSSPADIGSRLTELREALGRSQAAFARLAGISPQALNNWEKGNNRPSIDMAYRISAGTGGVPVGYILSGDPRGMPSEIVEKLQAYRRFKKQATG